MTWAEDSLSIEPVGTRVTRRVLNMSHPPGRFGDDTFPDPTVMDDFVVEARVDIVVRERSNSSGPSASDRTTAFCSKSTGGAFVDWDETFNAFFGPGTPRRR